MTFYTKHSLSFLLQSFDSRKQLSILIPSFQVFEVEVMFDNRS